MPVPPCVVEHADYPHVRFGSCPIGTEMQEFALGPKGELRSCTLHTEEIGDARTIDAERSPREPPPRDGRRSSVPLPHRSSCMGVWSGAADDARYARCSTVLAQHVDEASGRGSPRPAARYGVRCRDCMSAKVRYVAGPGSEGRRRNFVVRSSCCSARPARARAREVEIRDSHRARVRPDRLHGGSRRRSWPTTSSRSPSTRRSTAQVQALGHSRGRVADAVPDGGTRERASKSR